MTDGHRAHLFASLLAVEDMARQMERAGHDGRSPASGQALAPLSPEEWDELADRLTQMRERLMDAVRTYAPERLAEKGVGEGRSATTYWLSVLLRRLEEDIVDDLAPARVERKFGALEMDEASALARLSTDLHDDLAVMRSRLDGMRSGKGS